MHREMNDYNVLVVISAEKEHLSGYYCSKSIFSVCTGCKPRPRDICGLDPKARRAEGDI